MFYPCIHLLKGMKTMSSDYTMRFKSDQLINALNAHWWHQCDHNVQSDFTTSVLELLRCFFPLLSLENVLIEPGLFSASCILPDVSRNGLFFNIVLYLYLVSCHFQTRWVVVPTSVLYIFFFTFTKEVMFSPMSVCCILSWFSPYLVEGWCVGNRRTYFSFVPDL